jgi:hypothetical protein
MSRDSGQVSQLVTQSVFTAALAFVFASRSPEGMRAAAVTASALFSIQLGFELGSRTLPRERGTLALFLFAPLTAARHVLARTVALGTPVALAVVPVAATALALARSSGLEWLAGLVPLVLLGLTAMAGGLAIGAWHGNPAWRSPAEMLDRTGQYLSVGVFIGVVALAVIAGNVGTLPGSNLSITTSIFVCLAGLVSSGFALRATVAGMERFEMLNQREGLRETG